MKHYLFTNTVRVIFVIIAALSFYFLGVFLYRLTNAPVYHSGQGSSASTETPFSEKQISQHKTLWQGYINARKEIAEKLQTVDRAAAKSRTYSPYRALKLAETFAYNGDILHRLYFENLTATVMAPSEQLQAFIAQTFGSFEAFKDDFIACGQSARGWVMTAYSLDDHKLYNFLLEEHNQCVPLLTVPLLILDVYEHAYMIDFGIDRTTYLNLFWEHINWDVVQERYTASVLPLIGVPVTSAAGQLPDVESTR